MITLPPQGCRYGVEGAIAMSEIAHGTGSKDSPAVLFAAGGIVASVVIAIAAVVHFAFSDSALAGAIGFGALFLLAIGVKLFPRR